jgi:hypothetical protein
VSDRSENPENGAVVSAVAKEVAMRSPSVTAQQGEKLLGSNEVSELSCTDAIRRSVSKTPGIIMDSERVTHSDEFGYIYRYDVSQVLDDEKFGSYTYRMTYVMWTFDCEL